MIPKSLDKIEAADILALVTNADEERRTMDFKRDLPGNADKDKNELRADVTSFANAGGGDLIFGVDEANGKATAVLGLPGVNVDAEVLRIESVIQSNVDPRVPGFESHVITIPGKAPVIVVRVPKSWRGPHLVRINDTFRMYGRNSKGKYIFDATEIRSAYAMSEELPERIRRWRDDRLAKIIGGDTPVPLERDAYLVIHTLPLASFSGTMEFSVGTLKQQSQLFRPPYLRGWSNRVNSDGLVVHSGPTGRDKKNTSYCQVFRNGRVEAVWSEIASPHDGKPMIASVAYEEVIVESVGFYLKGMRALEVQLPVVVFVSIHGAKGAWLAVNARRQGFVDGLIDRDMLLLPDVLVEDYECDLPTLLRPVFDAVWNSAGWERSMNYDENGKWNPR